MMPTTAVVYLRRAIGAIYKSTKNYALERASWPLLWLVNGPSYLEVVHTPGVRVSIAVQLGLHL